VPVEVLIIFMPLRQRTHCPVHSYVHLSVHLFTRWFVCSSGWSCYRDISWTARTILIAPTDDLIRFWRSKVKVTAGHRGKGIHVDAWALKTQPKRNRNSRVLLRSSAVSVDVFLSYMVIFMHNTKTQQHSLSTVTHCTYMLWNIANSKQNKFLKFFELICVGS